MEKIHFALRNCHNCFFILHRKQSIYAPNYQNHQLATTNYHFLAICTISLDLTIKIVERYWLGRNLQSLESLHHLGQGKEGGIGHLEGVRGSGGKRGKRRKRKKKRRGKGRKGCLACTPSVLG